MAILDTSKYEEDPIKIEGVRVATTRPPRRFQEKKKVFYKGYFCQNKGSLTQIFEKIKSTVWSANNTVK